MSPLIEFLNDLIFLVKLGFYFIYSIISLWFKNLFIPSRFLYKKVDNEIVLITGAASGIGKHLAKHFLKLNSIVICADSNETNLNKTINEFKDELKLNNISRRLYSYKIDVSSYEHVKALVQRIKKDVGNVSILINNAGIVYGKALTELAESEIRRIFDVNVLAQFWLCKEILPEMIKSNAGHIVNVASICGFLGGNRLTDYCSTKFAVYGFTESLRVELKLLNKNNGIVVSTVCPFHVRTPLFEGVKFDHFNWLNVSMEPEYVAKKIVHGILLNKELIYVPQLLATICGIFKGIQFTNFNDYATSTLAMNAIDRKKTN